MLEKQFFCFTRFAIFVRSQVFVKQALPNQFRVQSALHVELGKHGRQIAVLQCKFLVHGSKSGKQGHGNSFNITFYSLSLGLIRAVDQP